ncbi:MAG: thioredoxin-disulfide reductase [Bifidobacteriaceae bacterium]|jgi:thioredoxin reductase (NADPH)|nr:thioredoxin-disulfide reductase [Bifidobacteriaceae bacterium]
MSEKQNINDVVIIGSGPAGYTAGIYLGRAGIKPVLISGLLEPGGSLMKTGIVENYPGFHDGIAGPDLMDKMEAQAKKFSTDIIPDDVVEVDLKSDIKKITLSSGESILAKSVIIATGAKYRHLGIASEEEFAGRGVSYCATCDGFFFSGKQVAVVGGGDTAVGEAIYLSSICSRVTVIHRRDQLRATKTLANRAKAIENIEFIWDSKVSKIEGDDSGVTKLQLENVHGSEKRSLDCAGVFIAIGHTPSTSIFENQIDMDSSGYIIVNDKGTQTSCKGVFAAGDCVDGKYRQAVIAAASGAKAALDADEHLQNKKGEK